VCELLAWRRPNGRLKNHECRLLLEELEQRELIRLPEVRGLGRRGTRKVALTECSEADSAVEGSAGDFEPLVLQPLDGSGPDGRLWRELIERYHYLGYRTPVGAHLRYLVRSERVGGRVLACLLWTSPAWKMAARDRWIGWDDAQRQQHLQSVVNNARFLILPWVKVRGLASKILALCARRLPDDWERRYRCRPLLLETLVDTSRFRGTCYLAANWIPLGQTQGRGRMDRDGTTPRRPKEIFVYPLCGSVRAELAGSELTARGGVSVRVPRSRGYRE
jgi:hypothetical protein